MTDQQMLKGHVSFEYERDIKVPRNVAHPDTHKLITVGVPAIEVGIVEFRAELLIGISCPEGEKDKCQIYVQGMGSFKVRKSRDAVVEEIKPLEGEWM